MYQARKQHSADKAMREQCLKYLNSRLQGMCFVSQSTPMGDDYPLPLCVWSDIFKTLERCVLNYGANVAFVLQKGTPKQYNLIETDLQENCSKVRK